MKDIPIFKDFEYTESKGYYFCNDESKWIGKNGIFYKTLIDEGIIIRKYPYYKHIFDEEYTLKDYYNLCLFIKDGQPDEELKLKYRDQILSQISEMMVRKKLKKI